MIKICQQIFLCLFPICLMGQSVDLNRKVTFRYKNQQLGFILSDISRRYSIPFSYSSNFIPVAKRMSISERNIPLKEGLEKLFEPTQIIYAVIGNSIALRIDASKEVIPIIEKPSERNRNIETEDLTFLKKYSYPLLVWEHPIPPEVLAKMKKTTSYPYDEKAKSTKESTEEEGFLNKQLVQVTLLPPVSTHEEAPEKTVSTFSFNILWGRNGGSDGIELGGFVNTLVYDMRGFQLAGVGNQVFGDAQGAQVAGIFNYNTGFTRGVQASLFNIANSANVIQLAGIANVVEQDFEGIQVALVANLARTKADGVQVAGFANVTNGTATRQFTLGLNKAKTLSKLQVGLINFANYAQGHQIGLINISRKNDQIPIGLINLIKDGYNKIEVSVGDALYANVGVKLGTKKFYNIFQLGSRITESFWGIGYGIGTAFQVNEQQALHLELLASHINENEGWTKNLNLLSQVKLNYDWQLNGRVSFFIGPSLNVLASKLVDVDTICLLYTSPSPRDRTRSRMPSSA